MAVSKPGKSGNFLTSTAFIIGLLFIVYLAFIAFVSLYVPDFISPRRVARAGAGELFFRPDEFQLRWWNLPDIVINLLMYLPLGYLVALGLATRAAVIRTGIYPWLGVLLSVGLETAQAYIGRFSDVTDVLSNGGGFLIGFYIARAAVMRNGARSRAPLVAWIVRQSSGPQHPPSDTP